MPAFDAPITPFRRDSADCCRGPGGKKEALEESSEESDGMDEELAEMFDRIRVECNH